MALFQKLQRTVCKLTRPVVQKANTTELAQSEEDEETCDYAVALQADHEAAHAEKYTDHQYRGDRRKHQVF